MDQSRLHAIYMESIKVYPGLQRMRGAQLDAAGPELESHLYGIHRLRNVSALGLEAGSVRVFYEAHGTY